MSKTDDVEFLIVGDGPLMSEMKKELQNAGCIGKVRFVGLVSHEKIPDYLNKMKFHILPSHTEAFGGAAIEAMACGAISLEFARQNLSLDMVVKKTEELYASILKQKP